MGQKEEGGLEGGSRGAMEAKMYPGIINGGIVRAGVVSVHLQLLLCSSRWELT